MIVHPSAYPNRLFFRPEHAGMTKTDAARKTLEEINPDVVYEAHTYNITKLEHYDHFLDRLRNGGKDNSSSVDLVLGCVDNFEARITVNQVRCKIVTCFSDYSLIWLIRPNMIRRAWKWDYLGWRVVCQKMLFLGTFNSSSQERLLASNVPHL